MSDVIKNPNRSVPHIQKQYEPEHVRLGVEPIIKGEALYASVDNVFIPDENGDYAGVENGHIIDNNDYVFPETQQDVKQSNKPNKQEQAPASKPTTAPEIGDYILMVFGKLILTASKTNIEQKVKDIMYGDDKDFSALDVKSDDIVVLKRVNIKVGIFLDE